MKRYMIAVMSVAAVLLTRTILAIAVLVVSLFGVGPAMATVVVDQSQLSDAYPMSTFSYDPAYYLAQSFEPSADNITGAAVLTVSIPESGYYGSADVTISLFDALPDASGNLLASGIVGVQAGDWATVTWPQVAITPNATYYLVFTDANETGSSFGLAGDIGNPYLRGQVCIGETDNSDWSDYDYTFKTFAETSPVPEPSSILLLGIGAVSMMVYAWRKRTRTA